MLDRALRAGETPLRRSTPGTWTGCGSSPSRRAPRRCSGSAIPRSGRRANPFPCARARSPDSTRPPTGRDGGSRAPHHAPAGRARLDVVARHAGGAAVRRIRPTRRSRSSARRDRGRRVLAGRALRPPAGASALARPAHRLRRFRPRLRLPGGVRRRHAGPRSAPSARARSSTSTTARRVHDESLRSRLILGSAVIALVPLTAAMLLLTHRIESTVRAQAAGRLEAALGGLQPQVRSDGERVADQLGILAARSGAAPALPGANRRQPRPRRLPRRAARCCSASTS